MCVHTSKLLTACVCVCVCPSVFKDGSSDLAGASAPSYTMKTHVGSRATSIALIHECDKCTTIFRLHHPPTGPLYFAFFSFSTLLLRGTENVSLFRRPVSSYDEQIARRGLFTGGKTKQETTLKNGHRS